MQQANQLTEFGAVLIFIIMGVLFVLSTFFVASLVAPKNPNAIKLTTYECGEEPTGNSWIQFNSRFYIIALVFLLFDVEMVFIFPWATVFGQEPLILADARWGWLSLAEMFIFVGILLLGLVYVWKKGDLEWVKPAIKKPSVLTAIPPDVYTRINNEVYKVKKYIPADRLAIPAEDTNTEYSSASNKPLFKPVFRKPAQQ